MPPPHIHSGKTHSNQSQRSLSNPRVQFSVKKKGFYLCYSLSSGTRGSRKAFIWATPYLQGQKAQGCCRLKASSQKNSTTCLSKDQASLCTVVMLEGHTGRARLSEASCSAHRHDTGHTQLLLPVPVKVPGLDAVKFPRVRGKPQWFSSHSCYAICTVEKSPSR